MNRHTAKFVAKKRHTTRRDYNPHTVVQDNDVEKMRDILEKHTINFKNKMNKKLLPIACEKGSIEMAELLLKHGARPKSGPAMYNAIKIDNIDIVKLLIKYGADCDRPMSNSTRDDIYPIMHAIKHSTEIAMLLIELGARLDVIEELDSWWMDIPIIRAIHLGKMDIVRAIYEKKGDEPFQDCNGDILKCIGTKKRFRDLIVDPDFRKIYYIASNCISDILYDLILSLVVGNGKELFDPCAGYYMMML